MKINRKGKSDGVTQKMPAQKAPAEVVALIPALDLPEQKSATPTLKSKVAVAILQRLEERRRGSA